MSKENIFSVILWGRSGTKLWPLSRKSFPKQFLFLNGDQKKSLLQETQERIKSLKGIKDPILICNEEHRFSVAKQMKKIDINPSIILLESFGRNTSEALT